MVVKRVLRAGQHEEHFAHPVLRSPEQMADPCCNPPLSMPRKSWDRLCVHTYVRVVFYMIVI